MKYREDMMKNHKKGPGMHSDRLGITPRILPLECSSHMLERERDGNGGIRGRFGGGEKETSHINQVWRPYQFCAGADCPGYPGGPSTSENVDTDN